MASDGRLTTAMYSAHQLPVSILMLSSLFLCAFSQNITDLRSLAIQRSTIYVMPEDSTSQVSCSVEYCYHLKDVLSNSFYFFDFYTTLELLPGIYNIYERVGQSVLIRVTDFILKGSPPNVTIVCQPGASWGLTIINSLWIEISHIMKLKEATQV